MNSYTQNDTATELPIGSDPKSGDQYSLTNLTLTVITTNTSGIYNKSVNIMDTKNVS